MSALAGLPREGLIRIDVSIADRSLSRKFRGSDGEEYKWAYRSIQDQEWSVSYAALQMPHD